ncbi:MAG TPA: Holliday junction resolvase RuvX [Bacillota bacterium]|nr:Holliday junction resolvase RuvX [Bacillota bacterium]
MKALGVDMGKVRIGTAVSDPEGLMAMPCETIEYKGNAKSASAIAALADRLEADVIVVGMPLRMDGTRGPAAEFVEGFLTEMRSATSKAVLTWDERLTSAQAQKLMISADVSRKERKAAVDCMAAALMLQSYLDYARSGRG